MSATEAIKALRGQCIGTYLVRYSSVRFFFSKIIELIIQILLSINMIFKMNFRIQVFHSLYQW